MTGPVIPDAETRLPDVATVIFDAVPRLPDAVTRHF